MWGSQSVACVYLHENRTNLACFWKADASCITIHDASLSAIRLPHVFVRMHDGCEHLADDLKFPPPLFSFSRLSGCKVRYGQLTLASLASA